MAILFGVGHGSMRLPMPTFTEETACLGDLVACCLQADAARRPSFADLLGQNLLAPVAEQLARLDEARFMRLQMAWRAQVSAVQRIRSRSVASSFSSSSSSSASASSKTFANAQKITRGSSGSSDGIHFLAAKRRKILVPVHRKSAKLAKCSTSEEDKENLLFSQEKTGECALPKLGVKRKLASVELDENGNELFAGKSKRMKASSPAKVIKSGRITGKKKKPMKECSNYDDSLAFPFSASDYKVEHSFPTPSTAVVDANLVSLCVCVNQVVVNF